MKCQSMKINLIIASYGGISVKHSENKHKKHYLKLNLQCLNALKTNLTCITIMKPSINANDQIITDYYDFSHLDIGNIRDKIQVYECDNVGISYGQYFAGISHNLDCDIHFWIEDDYIICADHFDNILIKIMREYRECTHLCPFIYTNRKWDIVPYAESIQEEPHVVDILRKRLCDYEMHNMQCHVPDMMQLGILTKTCVQKILDAFTDFISIYYLFNIPFTKIWLHQILFGYVLCKAGIELRDTSQIFTNIFYETSINKIFLCNYPENVNTWKERVYSGEKLWSPLCVPTEILLYPEHYYEDLTLMKKYMCSPELFDKRTARFRNEVNDALKCMQHNICIRGLEEADYDRGYMELMFEFTHYKYHVSRGEFCDYLQHMKNTNKIYVVYSYTSKTIIGAGTIFKLDKLHNNPVGQIEDFIVSKDYQKQGVGHMLLRKLIDTGLYDLGCYKVILKTHDETRGFYEKAGFGVSGLEMKLV